MQVSGHKSISLVELRPGSATIDHNFVHVSTAALVHCSFKGHLAQLQDRGFGARGRLSGSEPRSGAVRCRISMWAHAVVGQEPSQCALVMTWGLSGLGV